MPCNAAAPTGSSALSCMGCGPNRTAAPPRSGARSPRVLRRKPCARTSACPHRRGCLSTNGPSMAAAWPERPRDTSGSPGYCGSRCASPTWAGYHARMNSPLASFAKHSWPRIGGGSQRQSGSPPDRVAGCASSNSVTAAISGPSPVRAEVLARQTMPSSKSGARASAWP